MKTHSINPEDIELKQLHGLLLSAVAPRPIAFASTVDTEGNVNLSPFSFFNVFSANPPILIFSPARRVRDNTTKHTLDNVIATKEVVINTVNYAMVEQMSLASTEYDQGVNEFDKAGFTAIPSLIVQAPRVQESPVSLECVVEQIMPLGDQGGAGNLVIAKVVKLHVQEKYLDASGKLVTQKLDMVARMGQNWYTRANEASLFEIPKPIFTKGIGVDKLPMHILQSDILSGNNIGRLGNIEKIPTQIEINKYIEENTKLKEIIAAKDLYKLHCLIRIYLKENDVTKAALTAFSID